MARIDPYRLVSRIAYLDMPDEGPDLLDANDLLASIGQHCTNSGHYYASPAILRRLCWWQDDATAEVLKVWRDELVDRGEIAILPIGACCYSGATMDLIRVTHRSRHPRWSSYARPYIPGRIRQAVYKRDNFSCVSCSTTENLSLDHIHPYSHGGPDTFENLQTLCRSCNSRKGAKV